MVTLLMYLIRFYIRIRVIKKRRRFMMFDINRMIEELDRILPHYKNKYKAINIAALYARKVKDQQLQGLLDKKVNPIEEALKKCALGLIRYKE